MDNERIRVLYLDDEEQNLFAFKASFRREFDIVTTSSAQEAVGYLNDSDFHVVISDQKMPEVSGVEFFELIVQDFPDPARILLTGYADIEAVIDSINKGQIFRYLTKPWDENDVRMSIRNGYDLYRGKVDLRARNTELQKANAELERFVYSASHDLRAPLASVKGVLELAYQEGGDPTQYLHMIEKSVDKLDKFVCHVIDYFQNHKQYLRPEPFSLEYLIDEVIDSLGGEQALNGMKINRDIQLPRTLDSDRMRWRMIITNLISNALKYQDVSKADRWLNITGNIEHGKIQIAFEDNGVGMKPEAREKAFEMFFRSSTLSSGSGLGLYIVHEAVKVLGGTIRLESREDQGTKISISAPAVVHEN